MVSISTTVNGSPAELELEGHEAAVDAIRDQLDLTGTKLFLTKADLRAKFTANVEERAGIRTVDVGGCPIRYHFALSILVQNLAAIYHLWAAKHLLITETLSS